jgi:Carboxypeptidase regulatory-like domain
MKSLLKYFTFSFLLLMLANSLSAQEKTQNVKGKITDDASKQPIIGATIQLLSKDSTTTIGTTTDDNGNFRLENVPLGRQNFKISFISYEDKYLSSIMVTAGKEVFLDVALTESIEELQGASVVYDRLKDQSVTNNEYTTLSARSFSTEEAKRYAGALGDPSRMAANYAGVVSGNDSRNDIVVRGNSPTGMLWQLEGLNIPNHFGTLASTGGPVSILNNNVLAKSDFITSAFPAQYGNANAGAFDLRLRNGNKDKYEFVGQVGFNGFEVGAEGPFSKKYKGSFLINYRYSTLAVFNKIGVKFGTGNATPNYQDLNMKFHLPISKKGTITVFALGGVSDVAFLGNKEDTTKNNLYGDENSNTIVDFKMGVVGASYEHQISPKTFLKFTAGLMGTYQNYIGDSISTITRQEFRQGEAKFTTQKTTALLTLNHKFNAKNSLQAGVNVDRQDFNLFNKDVLGGLVDIIRVNIKDAAYLTQGYAQWKHRFNQKLTLNAGLHFQNYSLNQQSVIEPRFGLKFLATSRQSFGIGYGLHSQIQNIYTSYYITPTPQGISYTNKNLGFNRSHHFVASYENNLTDKLILRTEAYYQSLFDVAIDKSASSFSTLNTGASFAFNDRANLINNGTGYNYGVELTLEKSFSNNYYFLITTSVFNSKYKGSDNIERNTAFNSNYVFNILGGKEWKLKKNWVIFGNLRASTVGGRYFTPLNITASQLKGEAVYQEDKAYSEKQTPYFRIDVKVGYRKEYKKSSLEFTIELQNITANQNIFQQSYNRRTNQLTTQYQQGFCLVPFVRYTF